MSETPTTSRRIKKQSYKLRRRLIGNTSFISFDVWFFALKFRDNIKALEELVFHTHCASNLIGSFTDHKPSKVVSW